MGSTRGRRSRRGGQAAPPSPPAGPEGTARLGARPAGQDEGTPAAPFPDGRLAPGAAGNNPAGSQPAGQGPAPPHATSVSCPAPVATPSPASARGPALPIHTSCRPALLRTRGPAWALHLGRQPHLLPREPGAAALLPPGRAGERAGQGRRAGEPGRQGQHPAGDVPTASQWAAGGREP